jgi:transposase
MYWLKEVDSTALQNSLKQLDDASNAFQENAVGIDSGLKYFLVNSNAKKEDVSEYFRKYEKKLARWQRILSRRQYGECQYIR